MAHGPSINKFPLIDATSAHKYFKNRAARPAVLLLTGGHRHAKLLTWGGMSVCPCAQLMILGFEGSRVNRLTSWCTLRLFDSTRPMGLGSWRYCLSIPDVGKCRGENMDDIKRAKVGSAGEKLCVWTPFPSAVHKWAFELKTIYRYQVHLHDNSTHPSYQRLQSQLQEAQGFLLLKRSQNELFERNGQGRSNETSSALTYGWILELISDKRCDHLAQNTSCISSCSNGSV